MTAAGKDHHQKTSAKLVACFDPALVIAATFHLPALDPPDFTISDAILPLSKRLSGTM